MQNVSRFAPAPASSSFDATSENTSSPRRARHPRRVAREINETHEHHIVHVFIIKHRIVRVFIIKTSSLRPRRASRSPPLTTAPAVPGAPPPAPRPRAPTSPLPSTKTYRSSSVGPNYPVCARAPSSSSSVSSATASARSLARRSNHPSSSHTHIVSHRVVTRSRCRSSAASRSAPSSIPLAITRVRNPIAIGASIDVDARDVTPAIGPSTTSRSDRSICGAPSASSGAL